MTSRRNLLLGTVATVVAPVLGPRSAHAAGGTLVIAMQAADEPSLLDGQIGAYQSTWLIDSLIADPLIVRTPEDDYKPALALSWAATPDGKSWTFHLRPDVIFQDGTPMNAEAVRANFLRIIDPKTKSQEMANGLGPIKSVETPDARTVVVNYDTPWVTLLDTVRRMPVWSPTAIAKWGAEWDRHLTGAGPFTLEHRIPNDRIELKRWDKYGGWNAVQTHAGPALLDGVTIRFIGEAAVLGNMVQTGDAHIAFNLPTDYVDTYTNKPGFVLISKDQAGTGLQMVMNIRKPPLDQIAVRQAILFASDMDAINKLAYDGLLKVMRGPLNSVHPCFDAESGKLYPTDPAKARALLDGAGWKLDSGSPIRTAKSVPGVADGTKLRIRYTVLHHKEIGEALQSQLRAVGIDLALEVVPGPVQLDRVNKRDFDLMYERQRSPDPMLMDMLWNSHGDQPGGWAWTGFKDPALDAKLAVLRADPDLASRCTVARAAQREVMENALILPTLDDPIYVAMTDKVHGFRIGAEGNWFFVHDASLGA